MTVTFKGGIEQYHGNFNHGESLSTVHTRAGNLKLMVLHIFYVSSLDYSAITIANL